MRRLPLLALFLPCLFALATVDASAAPPRDDDDDDGSRKRAMKLEFSDDAFSGAYAPAPSMGATPGGAQDIGYFRDRVAAGELPLLYRVT